MNKENSTVIVDLILLGGIFVALIFGWWVGRLNSQLRQQNHNARKQLAMEERLDETNATLGGERAAAGSDHHGQ